MADGFWPGQKITITITGEVKSILEPGVLEINTGAEIPYVIDPREPGVEVRVDGETPATGPIQFVAGDVVRARNTGALFALGSKGYLSLRRGEWVPYTNIESESFKSDRYELVNLNNSTPPF